MGDLISCRRCGAPVLMVRLKTDGRLIPIEVDWMGDPEPGDGDLQLDHRVLRVDDEELVVRRVRRPEERDPAVAVWVDHRKVCAK